MMLNKFLLFCFFFNCGKTFAQPPIDSIITLAALKEHVTALAHDSMRGRLTQTRELNNAALYIANQFKEVGIKPIAGNNGYFWSYYYNAVDGRPGVSSNVMGAIQGDTGKVVIFSAHYDHIGTIDNGITRGSKRGRNRDSIFNGANDNATGVAALIELARYYASRKENEYSVIFIAFSGEEGGLVGSDRFADDVAPSQVAQVINMDMLAQPAMRNHAYLIGYKYDNAIDQMNDRLYATDKSYGKRFFMSDPYPEANFGKRSDHYSFYKRGMNAFTISVSSATEEYYHSTSDETETIGFPYLHRVVKAIAISCEPFLKK